MARSPTFWLRGLLFASLAVNMLILGVFVGGQFGPHDGPPRGKGAPRDGAALFVSALTKEERQALRTRFEERAAPRRDDRAVPLDDARMLLQADPFDPEAFRAFLDRLDRRGEARRMAGKDALTTFVAEMSPEERAAYVERLDAIRERARSGREAR